MKISSLVVLFITAQAFAGVVFEVETKDHDSMESGTVKVLVDGKNLNMVITPGVDADNQEMIFRGDRREMIIIQHDHQSYMIINEAMMHSMAEQLSGFQAQMQEALKNVPPERRAMLEQMMEGQMPPQTSSAARPKVELRRTSESATKNGYPCVKYEARRAGHKIREMWVTSWDNIEGGDEAAQAFEGMSEFFQRMQDSMPSMGDEEDNNPFDYMKEMNGYPVLTYEFAADGSLEGESSLKSSTRRTLDTAEFEPPSGYKSMQMMPQ